MCALKKPFANCCSLGSFKVSKKKLFNTQVQYNKQLKSVEQVCVCARTCKCLNTWVSAGGWSQLCQVHKSQLCTSFSGSMFSNFMLAAWNWPWWEYLWDWLFFLGRLERSWFISPLLYVSDHLIIFKWWSLEDTQY